VVGYGPFSLWVIHKEGLCPSSGDFNRLMMMMMILHADDVRTIDRKIILYTQHYKNIINLWNRTLDVKAK
jgi:hypothetical protein